MHERIAVEELDTDESIDHMIWAFFLRSVLIGEDREDRTQPLAPSLDCMSEGRDELCLHSGDVRSISMSKKSRQSIVDSSLIYGKPREWDHMLYIIFRSFFLSEQKNRVPHRSPHDQNLARASE